MWRRGNGGDVGSGLGPDQQNRTRGVIDDEPGGLAQAPGAEPAPVAVPGRDEQIRLSRGCYHGPFGATLNVEPLARPPEPARGGREQFARRGRRHLLQPGRRVAGSRPARPNRPA